MLIAMLPAEAFAAKKCEIWGRIVVHENTRVATTGEDSYIFSDGAKVYYGNELLGETTSGVLNLTTEEVTRLADKQITVKKDGFKDSTVTVRTKNFTLAQLDRNNLAGPTLNAVNMSMVSKLNKDYDPVNALEDEFEIDVTNKEAVYFDIDCDFKDTELQSVVLYQQGIQKKYEYLSFSCDLGASFDLSEDINIIITDDHGYSVSDTLSITTFSSSAFINKMEGGGLDFGEALSFTIPSGVPIIGGMPLNLGIANPLPVAISFEGGKWCGTIGLDLAYAKTGEGLSGPIENFKCAYHQEVLKEKIQKFKDFTKDYKKAMKANGGFLATGDISVMGFVEGCVKDDKPVILDAGIILVMEGSLGYVVPFTLVIPMFFETSLEGTLEGTANIYVADEMENLKPLGEISITPSISGGVGIGLARVANVSGGLKGILNILWKFGRRARNYFKVSGELKAYVKATLVFFSTGKDWKLAEKTFYEYPKVDVGAALADEVQEDLIGSIKKEDFKLVDISYLEEASEDGVVGSFYDSEEQAVAGFGYSDAEDAEVLVGNLYRESQVALGRLSDGREVAVYVHGDSADYDKLQLYISIHNPEGWTKPTLVSDDNTTDTSPYIYVQKDKIYIAWQNATKSFFAEKAGNAAAEMGLDDIAKHFDISVATVSSNGITENVKTFATAGLDTMPVLTGDGEKVYVAWNCNKDCDWFSEKPAKNAIYAATLDNGAWSDAQLQEGMDSIDNVISLDIDAVGGKLNIAYAAIDNRSYVDETEETDTVNRPRYVYENGRRVSAGTANESAPQYLDHKLYWYSEGNVVGKDFEPESGEFTSDDYDLMMIDDVMVAIYKENDGIQSYIMLAAYDDVDNVWIHGSVFATNDSNIQDFAYILKDDYDIEILVNDVKTVLELDEIDLEDDDKTNDNPYGEAQLVMIYSASESNAEISDCDVDIDSFELGEEVSVEAEVYNSGTKVVKDFEAVLYDSKGNKITSKTYDDDILPGETITISMTFIVTDVEAQRDLYMEIYDGNEDEEHLDKANITMRNENIGVVGAIYSMTDATNADIYVAVENDGDSKRENIKVELSKGSYEGEVVANTNIDCVEAGDYGFATLNIPVAEGDVYYVHIDDATSSKEKNIGDDYDYVVITDTKYSIYDCEGIDNVTKIEQKVSLGGTDYAVNFIPGNGQSSELYTAAGNGMKLAKLTKDGYTFKGWYNESAGKKGKKVSKLTKKYLEQNPNLVLTARWVQNQYNVKFVVSKPGKKAKPTGKPGKMAKVNYRDLITLPKNLECSGYTFKGWATEKNGKVVYEPGDQVQKIGGKTKKDKNIKLYSVWESTLETTNK